MKPDFEYYLWNETNKEMNRHPFVWALRIVLIGLILFGIGWCAVQPPLEPGSCCIYHQELKKQQNKIQTYEE